MRFSQGDAVFAYLYGQGTQYRAYFTMGAHCIHRKKSCGVYFATWAPFAKSVSVVGDFNGWDAATHPMKRLGITGLWELFIENLPEETLYKYAVVGEDCVVRLKADPYGYTGELRPQTASIVYDIDNYVWNDRDYISRLRTDTRNPVTRPINIYEVHLTSWLEAVTDDKGIDLGSVGAKLAQYAKDMNYTHIELLPVMEHPLDASWGYQLTGYYATTARLGKPRDLMAFIDACHALDIGVIIDWVPGHFCKDEPGLYQFDGTPLYGWEDHPHWGTEKFNFAYRHVWSFLISNALFWIDLYHVDGLRVDGMASMIDLNYGLSTQRRNRDGGSDNIEALEFLRKFNSILVNEYPGVLLFTEDSSTYPKVTQPGADGGLGFHFKWNMGWMNDTLAYMDLTRLIDTIITTR
jgi:1,4-alpha-glucan branching enzyme